MIMENIARFERFAKHGWVTRHRKEVNGVANGVFPILDLTLAKGVSDLMGGYSTLIEKSKTRKGLAELCGQLGKLAAFQKQVIFLLRDTF